MKNRKATLVRHDKVVLKSGVIVEAKIWNVPVSDKYPDGIRYSLFAIHSDGKVLVGYDNHYPKGHHRHIGDTQEPYVFTDLEKLRNDFKTDLETEMSKRGLI